MFPIILFILFLFVLYKYLTLNYDYWEKRNIPYERPKLLFGNFKETAFLKKNFSQVINELYNKFSNSPFIGFYKMRIPCLLLTKPEHIEQALIHDSDFFWKNEINIDPDLDIVAIRNPFFLFGNKWKKSRTLFSPMLSQARIKHLSPFLIQTTTNLVKYIEKNKTCEALNLISRYVADANALSAFGINGESFEKEDAFYWKLGQFLIEMSGWKAIRFSLMILIPQFAKIFKIKFLPESSIEYLKQTILTAIDHRKKHNINNNDFLDAILSIKNDSFNENDILSWSSVFLYDANTSNQTSYVLYALAKNLEVQEKLRNEIDMVLKKYNDCFTYDAIQNMNYLECVIWETTRLYPSIQINLKRCTGYYEFKMENDEFISIEPGMSIAVCVSGMQRDEKYFKNPLEFIPERFSENNKANIQKGTFLPFGLGKRYCPGMKFAMITMKIAIVAIIKEFEITLNEKTGNPFDLKPGIVMGIPKSGVWINFSKRKN